MSSTRSTSARLRPVPDPAPSAASTTARGSTIVDPSENLVVLIVGGATSTVGTIVRQLATMDACGVNAIVVEHASGAMAHLEAGQIALLLVFDDCAGQIMRYTVAEKEIHVPLIVVAHGKGSDRAALRANMRREGAAFCLFSDEVSEAVLAMTIVGAVETSRKLDVVRRGASLEFDDDTGLHSPNAFLRRVGAAIAHSDADPRYRYSVLVIDMSTVTEGRRLDIDQAMALRAQVGRRLGRVCGHRVAARVEGGYAVLFRGFDDGEDLLEMEALVEEIQAPYSLGDDEVTLRLGFGSARGRGFDANARAAIERARDNVRVLRQPMRPRSHLSAEQTQTAANELAADLGKALANNEFALTFQPIVALEDRHPIGFEALIRWRHPDGDERSAAEFIQAAQDTNLIVPIGYWCLEAAMRQMVDWKLDFACARELVLSINLSSQQVVDSLFAPRVRSLLMTTGLDPASVRFEIEAPTIVSHPEESRVLIEDLSGAGTGVWIEDFGMGACTIDHLRGLPIDGLKVDRAFVSKIDGSEARSAPIRHVINTAKALGVRPLAEGIENALQSNVLRWLDCDVGQGYMYAHPLAVGDVYAYLAALE